MADRQTQIRAPPQSRLGTNSASFLQKLHDHAPMGVLTLVVSGAVLLLLTGASVALTVLGLVFFVPIIVLSSPLWVPLAAVFFFVAAGFISVVGFGVAAVAGFSWVYRYVRGLHPPGSDRVDYARSRIFDTASHVKDYAREYGGYLQSKVKDAAPGA